VTVSKGAPPACRSGLRIAAGHGGRTAESVRRHSVFRSTAEASMGPGCFHPRNGHVSRSCQPQWHIPKKEPRSPILCSLCHIEGRRSALRPWKSIVFSLANELLVVCEKVGGDS
jgi:hypothetical protein